MIDAVIIQRFLLALALGALVGLEREYARHRKKGHQFAGIRTFPLIALFGALSAYFGEVLSPWILLMGMFLVGILIVVAYFRITDRTHVGATSEIAGFLVFLIGVLVYENELVLAVVLAIIITLILYARSILHRFAEHIKEQELSATLKFTVIAFLILPLLPNKEYGPLGIFNPFLIWLMVVFISGISLIGYILLKWVGEKGLVLTGLLGGLTSSTATIISFSEQSKQQKKHYRVLATGVIAANGMMMLRTIIVATVLNPALFPLLVIPVGILLLLTVLLGYITWSKTVFSTKKITLNSPFTVKPALQFGLLFAVIIALIKIVYYYFSSQGVYVLSFLSGVADMDAITISLAQISKESLLSTIAVKGILVATLTSIAVKGGIAYWTGERKFRNIVAGVFLVLIIVGIGVITLS